MTDPMAAPGLPHRPRHWVYLDDARTHEVHAQLAPRTNEFLLNMTEFPAGSRDPTEALVDERRLDTTEQVRVALAELEQRLALSGTYFRADVEDMRWSPLQAPAGARKVDLRAFEAALPGATTPGAKMTFHHFHSSSKERDSLVIAMPRADLGVPRSILAQLDFDFPRVDQGDLKVLHTRLAPGTLRSAVVKQHVELPAHGYSKLVEPRDYERAFGNGWVERTREVFRRAAARVFSLAPPPPPPPVAKDHAYIAADRLEKAVVHPKLRAIRDRYVTDAEAERILAGGELGIRRYVQVRRKKADHHTIYDLSLLESLLLVEYGLKRGQQALLDEEGAKLLRYAMPDRAA